MAQHRLFAAFKAAFPVSLPVLAGYLFLGAGYGVLMSRIGYGPIWTAIISLMILGGTIQYIATALLVQPFSPANALVVSLLVNARHIFYGFSMLEEYSGTGWKKPFLIFWLTDETFALVCSAEPPENVDPHWFHFFISGLDYFYWMLGGVVGNLAGSYLAFNSKGIEFVMTALFTAIVVGQWKSAEEHSPALAGVLATAGTLAVFGPDHFLIPAMILIVGILLFLRRRLERRLPREEGCQ